MHKHDTFRWVYASLGLWPIVSLFLLLGGEKSLMNARIGETGVLMLGGLLALWVACLNHVRQDLMQAIAGLTPGSSMIATRWRLVATKAPWLFGSPRRVVPCSC